jgi:hypothetical protein
MKSPFKKPPPDCVGNILGRMARLRFTAHYMACEGTVSDDPKEERNTLPKDYDKRLKSALKKLEPEFKSLERRLKKCPKPKLTSSKPKTKPKKPRASSSPSKATMKPVSASKRPKGVLASVLDGDDSAGPLSREGALTEGVKVASTTDLLDFMQSKLG